MYGVVSGANNRCDVATYNWHIYVMSENLNTNLLLFLEDHVHMPAFLDNVVLYNL